METLKSKFQKLSVNHLCFVGLCGIIAYLFRAGDTYYLKPVWRKRVESRYFTNNHFPTENDRLPAPVVTDLESDGINEIVLITNDLKLSILAIPEVNKVKDGSTLPHTVVKHKVRLPLQKIKHGKISRPVVMATGFTSPYMSMMQIRKQIIVIVTDDWQVLCYTPDLQLLWQTQLLRASQLKETYIVKALDALVTSHSIKKNDEGLIIIGGSFSHKIHQDVPQDESKQEEHSNHTTEEEDFAHFSTFALSGNNGSIRWHHLAGDFEEKKQDIKDEGGEYHWKLGLRKSRLHKGESPWTFYKHTILQFMPHMWTNLEDTKFTLARFQKGTQKTDGHTEEDEDENERNTQSSALKPEHIVGYAYGGQRPHSSHEHVENPNAVVAHNHNGIEVLNLLSGRPITRVELPADSSIYMDIDNDDNAEKITWGQFKDHTACYLEVWRLAPLKEKLEQIPVCITKRMFWTRSWAVEEDFHKKVPPYIVKSIAKKNSIIRHLLGHHLSAEQGYDIVTAASLGRVSSFDFEGNIHWQSQTSASWADISMAVRRSKNLDGDSAKEFFHSFQPSRVPMPVHVFGMKDAVAVVGYKGIAVVSMRDGTILAEHTIPAPPTAHLVYGDFNNDGINDLILTCKMGYIGFTMNTQTNHMFTAMYAAAVFLSIVVVTFCLSPEVLGRGADDDDDD